MKILVALFSDFSSGVSTHYSREYTFSDFLEFVWNLYLIDIYYPVQVKNGTIDINPEQMDCVTIYYKAVLNYE